MSAPRLTREQLQAVVRLQGDNDFEAVMAYLATLQSEYQQRMMYADEHILATQRGMVRAVTEIIAELTHAREALNRYK